MNKLITISISAMLFAGCTSDTSTTLPLFKRNITMTQGSVEYYPNQKVKKCKLSKPVMLGDKKSTNWLHLFESGHIKQFETAEEMRIEKHVVPANSIVFYNEKNRSRIHYIIFSKDTEIDSVICKGDGKTMTEFYNSGKLKACFLAKDQLVQGFPCKASISEPVYFYADGKVRILPLSADASYSNISFKSGESILVGQDGLVSKLKKQ
ncbi:MAG: hypothetical protein H7Y13_05680 [Sphingobacteriaceae bacterium]|nr:hypothetical protein [Sphingobacteriaceae bacterium]